MLFIIILKCAGMLPVTISRDGQRLQTQLSADVTTLERVLKHREHPASLSSSSDSSDQATPYQSSLRAAEPGQMSIAACRVSGRVETLN